MDDVRAQLRELSEWVDDQIGVTDTGFCLFVEMSHGWSYTSSYLRKDSVEMLQDWLSLTGAHGMTKLPATAKKETSQEVDDRLALERQCVEVAGLIQKRTGKGIGFFLFNSGKAAYFSNVKDIRERVAHWVELQRGLS